MRKRNKVGIGCLTIIVIIAALIAWMWFSREPRPIVVDDPGELGQRVTINDIPANFFAGSGDGPRPAILLLGGSEGGLKEYRNVYARQLAAEGYSVLYQGYYATNESNRSLAAVPIETFEKAIDWLKAREGIDGERIGLIGHSKGAEAALLIASRTPSVKAVVAAMPSDVVWQGFDFDAFDMSQFGSSWSKNGQDLPYVAYVDLPWSDWMNEGAGAIGKMYKLSWDARVNYPGSSIPVENIDAPIMMICGEQDTIWPSCAMARAAEERAQNATVYSYQDAGHWAFGPASNLSEGDKRYFGQMGGSQDADMAARKDQWPQILAFLEESLGE